MKIIKNLVLTLAFLVIPSSAAFGCVCVGPDNPKEALKYWSEAVFSGEIISIDGNRLKFKVERVWKGMSEKEVVVRDINIGSDCASTTYKIGERYFMFARFTNEQGKFFTDEQNKPIIVADTCSWIANISGLKGQKVLKKIGKGKAIN